jgi:transposase-like protein
MTQVTISEAARRVGVARSTLLRHIKNGKVSKVIGKDGKPSLDTSELLRVYGDLKVSDTDDTSATLHQNHSTLHVDTGDRYTEKDIEIATLRAELKATLQRSDEFKEERDEWRGVAKKGQALLTDAGQGRPRQGLWARVFGKQG